MSLDEGVFEQFLGTGASAWLFAQTNAEEVLEIGGSAGRRLWCGTGTDVVYQVPKLQLHDISAFVRLWVRKSAQCTLQ